MAGRRMGCTLRQGNHSRAAVAMGQSESPNMFLGEDRPLVVVAVHTDRAGVRARRRRGSLDSGRDLRDDMAGWGWTRIDFVRIALNIGSHIDRNATGADHMDSSKWVGLGKGCIRRCNGPAVPRPPLVSSIQRILHTKLDFDLLLGILTCLRV